MRVRYQYILLFLFFAVCSSYGQSRSSRSGTVRTYSISVLNMGWAKNQKNIQNCRMRIVSKWLVSGYTIMTLKGAPDNFIDAGSRNEAQNGISILLVAPGGAYYYIPYSVTRETPVLLTKRATTGALLENSVAFFTEKIKAGVVVCNYREKDCNGYAHFVCTKVGSNFYEMENRSNPDNTIIRLDKQGNILYYAYRHHGSVNEVVARFKN